MQAARGDRQVTSLSSCTRALGGLDLLKPQVVLAELSCSVLSGFCL